MLVSLWPNINSLRPHRGIREILNEWLGDISVKTNNEITLYIDLLHASGPSVELRFNAYLRIARTGYAHLLFQVSTPVPGPWPAQVGTPEGDDYSECQNEAEFKTVIEQVMKRDRTTEILEFLLTFIPTGAVTP